MIALKIENDQIRTKHGDPIKLMQTMDELAKLKSEMQKDDLGKVTETLQLT